MKTPKKCKKGSKEERIGMVFSRLKVSSFSHSKKRLTGYSYRHYYVCKCECGNTITTEWGNLTSGDTKSCGCIPVGAFKHGLRYSREYNIWCSMISRCENKNNPVYKHYGARGIKICDSWRKDFLSFFNDMGTSPSSKHSIGRKNNDGNYEPDNCRWETQSEQMYNTRRTVIVSYNGEQMNLSMLSNRLGIEKNRLYRHYYRNNRDIYAAVNNILSYGSPS